MGITAKELAKELHLSEAAVSLALNNKPGVSTQTRKRVTEAARKAGYDFSRIAEKQGSTGALCLLLYKKHGAVVADTPFFSELTQGVVNACREQKRRLKIVYFSQETENPERQMQELAQSDSAGMVLLGTEMDAQDVRPFLSLPFPLVLLDAYFDQLLCDSVLINNLQGAFQATSHLIRHCQKQPGYLRSSYPISNFDERASGFYNAIRASGLSVSQSIVHRLSPSLDGAYSDMLDLIRAGEPMAECYFADNDLIAAGAMKALKQEGFRIPQDISIVGFDDMPVSSAADPALTTVHVPKQYMGQTAVHRLLSRLSFPDQPPVKIQIAATLVHRQSVL